jgi:hypothetical protein
MTAVITPEGECKMTTSITEETGTTPATAVRAKPNKEARVGARRAHVAPKKGKPGKKASPAKKAPKAANKARAARDGSKAAKVLDLLKRPDGATLKELMKITGWPALLSGTVPVGKKMGLTIASAKSEDGERTYSVKA